MTIGSILQVATIITVASGAGAAIGTVATFAVGTRDEPAIVIRLDGAAPRDCRVVDTAGSETRARILDCGERVKAENRSDVRP